MIPRLGSCTRPDATCSQADSLGDLLHQLFEGLAHGCRTAGSKKVILLPSKTIQKISECRAPCLLRGIWGRGL